MTEPHVEPPVGEPLIQVVTRVRDGIPNHHLVDDDGNVLADLSSAAAVNLAIDLIEKVFTALTRPSVGR